MLHFHSDTVIEALASPDKERLKTDGSNISTWLQSLFIHTLLIFIFIVLH